MPAPRNLLPGIAPVAKRRSLRNRYIPQALMGPHGVVVVNICLSDVILMPQAETEQVIAALTLETADPRLRIAVGDGS